MQKINTFIIPHLNYGGLRKSLEKLRKHTPPNFYVVLIDQNDTYQQVDDLVDVHLRPNRNLGFAKASNWGIRLTDTEFVTILNDDVEMLNIKWWDGIMETFKRYGNQALCVNASSPRNPRASGDIPVNAPGWDYKEEFTDEEYDRMVKELGKGHVIDGICFWGPTFRRETLDKVKGSLPGLWFDERFFPGGGEDYDMNRRAYLTKNEHNELRGYRCLGTGLSFAWHWWYSTVSPKTGKTGVKDSGTTYYDKWGADADIYGRRGNMEIPMNTLREL